MVNTQVALNTKLTQLRGDALQQSLTAYQAEKNAASDTAKEIVSYKTMSMDELRNLEEDGSDTQKKLAKEEIKTRSTLKTSAEEAARYMKKIAEDLENARVQSIKDGRERELKLEELSLRKKLSEIKGNSALEIQLKEQLETEYQTNIAAIKDKYDDKERTKSYQLEKQKWETKLKGLIEGSIEWFNVSQTLLDSQREYELSNTDLTEQQKLDIEEKYRQMRENLNKKPDDSKFQSNNDADFAAEWEATKMMLERTGQMSLKKKKEIAEQERDMALAAAEGNAGEQMLIWEEFYDKMKGMDAEWMGAIIGSLNTLVNSFSGIDQALTAYEQAQLARDQVSNDKKKDNLKKRLDSGLISQKEYDAGVSKMDQEMAAKKRKIAHDEAVRQKAISLVQTIINTAQAVVAAMTVPYVGIALAVIAGIMGAAQIALIAATPIPEAAKGRYNVIGQDDNKLYREVPYEDTFTGIPGRPMLVNETGNEIVIDPETTKRLQRNSPEVIDAINLARQPGTAGQVIMQPGYVNNMRFRTDISDMIKGVPQRQAGYYPGQNAAAGSTPIIINSDNAELRAAINQLNASLKKGIRSFISYDHLEDGVNGVTDIQNEASR
jgi:hypothetical protein